MQIDTLHTVDTEYSADSVEWCPDSGNQDFFICGTYQLEERSEDQPDVPAKRKGRLHLFQYDRAADSLIQTDVHDTAAILDLKWSPKSSAEGLPLAAGADALGQVLLYRLNEGRMLPAGSVHLAAEESDLLTLAIDWSADHRLVASDSHGRLSVLQLGEGGSLNVVSSWSVHSFEAWTCAFNRHQPNVVYSGGDDMILYGFDTRSDNAKVLTNRSHGAGVTSLLSFGSDEHLLATGSYDEQLRVFDTRNFRAPLAEQALGGGIWRIRQHGRRKELLLCANMYHNFSVVEVAEGGGGLKVCAEYFEHKSICYGADWCADGAEELVMATCSFYDHKLCVAKVSGE